MTNYLIVFSELLWEQSAPGMRVKVAHMNGKQLRLVEFEPEFVEPGWCQKGHVGFVVDGELHLEVDGRVQVFGKGDALVLPEGPAHQHRHVTGSPKCTLFLVEDLEPKAFPGNF